LQDTLALMGDTIEVKDEGYAIDKLFPDVWYPPQPLSSQFHAETLIIYKLCFK
jgi:hypothetical protein